MRAGRVSSRGGQWGEISRLVALGATLAVFAPAKGFACAACYGGHIDDRMADGMNWAILTLGVIVATVLGTFLACLIHVIRKSEALEAAAQRKSPEPSKI